MVRCFRQSTGTAWSRRLLPLLVLAGLLALSGTAHAGYYSLYPCFGYGSGSASAGDPIDVWTGYYHVSDQLVSIPGRVPISIGWQFQSNVISNGPLGSGTSLSTDYFIEPYDIYQKQYELYGPGNVHYLLENPTLVGDYVNTTDPELLGAKYTFTVPRPSTDRAGTLRWKDGSRFFFNSTGQLYRVEDRRGNYITITRNATGYPTQITQPSGRSVTFSYNGNGKLASIALPLSRSWQFTYDTQQRLSRVIDPSGAYTEYTWIAPVIQYGTPLITTVKDRTGVVQITNTYDTQGRVTRQDFADGGHLTMTYGSGYTTVTDPRGGVTRYDIALRQNHNPCYNVSQVTDRLGCITQITRDPISNLVNAVTEQINPSRIRTTTFSWDTTRGNLTSMSTPTASGGAVTTTFTYEPTYSKLISATDPFNRQTVITVDPATGNTTAVRDPKNYTTSFSFDTNGDLLSSTNALNQTTSYTYSSNGELETITDPRTFVSSFGYDGASRRTSFVDAKNKTTIYGYNLMDQVTSITRTLSGANVVTTVQYDPEGKIRFVTDPQSHVWEWRYDNKGRLTQKLDPLLAATVYSWDLNDNMASWQDRKGQRGEFTYDVADRALTAVFKRANGTTESSYTVNYNASTKLVDNIVDSVAGTFSFTYDLLDRVLTEAAPAGTLVYTYDNLGRRTSLQATSQGLVSYGYDDRDAVTSITQNGLVTSFTYDELGRLSTRALGNGVLTGWTYDPSGNIASVGTGSFDGRSYVYDGVGNVISQSGFGVSRVNQYDDLYRLVSSTGTGYDYSWTYDLVGNRLSETRTDTGQYRYRAFTYNAANRLTAVDGAPVTHDANGNMTAYGNDVYTWDVRDRLVTLARPGLTAQFTYDQEDRRATKTINGTTTSFLWEGDDIVSEITGGTTVSTLHGPFTDMPLVRGGTWLAGDGLGSITALMNGSGSATGLNRYEPFGELSPGSTGGSSLYQFTGRDQDGTGLMYYRARYYAPEWGRFISEDPIGLAGGLNAYAYAGNNPISASDPFGLEPQWANSVRATFGGFGMIIGALGGGGMGGGIGFAAGVAGGPAAILTGGAGAVKGAMIGSGLGLAAGLGLAQALIAASSLTDNLMRASDTTGSSGSGGKCSGGGQNHHVLSRKIMRALDNHPTLRDLFWRNDPRFRVDAADLPSHKGYQEWHREIDDLVVDWLNGNPTATADQFLDFLQGLYRDPAMQGRFPGYAVPGSP